MIKTIYANQKPLREDYERQTQIIRDHIRQHDINLEKISNGTIYKCDSRGPTNPDDAMYFLPIEVGALGPK